MEQALIQVAIQVPAILVLGYIFLQVLKIVLDTQGRKIEQLIDAVEALKDARH